MCDTFLLFRPDVESVLHFYEWKRVGGKGGDEKGRIEAMEKRAMSVFGIKSRIPEVADASRGFCLRPPALAGTAG